MLTLRLWTNLTPKGQVGIIDWYTVLVVAGSFLALAVHGSLRTCSFGTMFWGCLVVTTLVISVASLLVQPSLTREFRGNHWGLMFVAFGVFPDLLPSNISPDFSLTIVGMWSLFPVWFWQSPIPFSYIGTSRARWVSLSCG